MQIPLLELPAFAYAVFVMYWSFCVATLTGTLQILNFTTRRNDAVAWGLGFKLALGITCRKLTGPEVFDCQKEDRTCVYLANHRSWADFFLDVLNTHGNACMLSRMAVAYAFPAFMVPVAILQQGVLFKRGNIRDKNVFNKKIDDYLAASPVNGLIVYPEGHRSTKPYSLPLKRGMLHYTYDRKHMCQVVVSANKEAPLSEKHWRARFGQTVLTGYSQPIDSGKFPHFEAFSEEVQRVWDEQWRRVYSASLSDGEEVAFDAAAMQNLDYPLAMRVKMCVACLLTLPFMLGFVALCAWLLLGCLRLTGPWQPYVTGALVAWIAASVANATRRVQPKPLAAPPAGSVNSGKGRSAREKQLEDRVPDGVANGLHS